MAKKKIPEMLPIKKWLSQPEAMSYMDMSKDTFIKVVVENRLSISAIGQKKYYRVDQLQGLIEQNILIA